MTHLQTNFDVKSIVRFLYLSQRLVSQYTDKNAILNINARQKLRIFHAHVSLRGPKSRVLTSDKAPQEQAVVHIGACDNNLDPRTCAFYSLGGANRSS